MSAIDGQGGEIAGVDDTLLLALAPSPDVFDAAVRLAGERSLKALKRTSDATLLFGLCEGSSKEDYEVSADLVGAKPVTRCSCPSRKRPCKHALALVLAYLRAADRFAEAEAPQELLAKRKTPAADSEKPRRTTKPRAPNKAAQAKKAQAQLDGLMAAEAVLVDIATAGLGAFDAARLENLRERARELSDSHLPGLALGLRRLALELEADGAAETKAARTTRRLGALWAMLKKGRTMLDQKLGDELAAESDAVIEELLGKIWQLDELKQRGFMRSGVTLVELAYRRVDDPAREERVETSYLLELGAGDGDVLRDIAYTPSRRIGKELPKPSRDGALMVDEAMVYPGFLNRRVRWDDEQARERPITAEDWTRVHAGAVPFAAAATKMLAQLRNLLAPTEAVFLVQVARAGRVGDDMALEDPTGTRWQVADDLASCDAFRAIEVAGWPNGPTAMLVELSLDGAALLASPLALVIPGGLRRLSL